MTAEHDRSAEHRDDIARLIRLAGRRQPVPKDRETRVKEAVRAHWRQEVRRRSRGRYLWMAAATATAASIVLAIVFAVSTGNNGITPIAVNELRVESLIGMAWVQQTDGSAPQPDAVAVGDTIGGGNAVNTGDDGLLAVTLDSGHSVRLDADTQLRLLESGSLALDRGAVYVDSGARDSSRGSLSIHTPLGVVREIGTQYEIRLGEDSMTVRVREGMVELNDGNLVHEVSMASELAVTGDGTTTRRAIAAHDARWSWIAAITPVPELEGLPALSFLEWVSREKGWRLSFSDEDVARSAAEITLGGTVEGLSLDQALEAVLPTCNLTHRVEDGVLVIASAR